MFQSVSTKSQPLTGVPEFVALYRLAFADYGAQSLWNLRQFDAPTQEDALVVAHALCVEGDMKARFLAERIERVCRAAL